jgi:Putative MetA-pathway of phenol degradation
MVLRGFMRPQRLFAFLTFAILSVTATAVAEESIESSCTNSSFVSVPSRPTVSNSTDTTQCGVTELEYGLTREWTGGSAKRDDLSGGLRLGLTHNLDFHWSSSDFLYVADGDGNRTGFGDSWLGLKYRFFRETKYRPSTGVFYQAKVPSASVVLGLGSGQVDHAISFLISKEIHPIHLDFNVTPLLAGRGGNLGFDRNVGFALSAAAPLSRRFGAVIEGYGYTALNDSDLGFAATMVGFTWQVRPRLILDTGLDVGVTAGAPQRRVFVGVTYAIANVYSWMRPQH